MKKKYKKLQKDFIPLKEGDIEGCFIVHGKPVLTFIEKDKEEYILKRPYDENNTIP